MARQTLANWVEEIVATYGLSKAQWIFTETLSRMRMVGQDGATASAWREMLIAVATERYPDTTLSLARLKYN